MATKTVKKVKAEKEEKVPKVEKYFYAVGRRKASIARVKLFVSEAIEEAVINGRKVKEYFPTLGMQNSFFAPFKLVPEDKKFRAEISVNGGGRKGQLGACILGIARALVVFDPEFKKVLKAEKLMTRDSRVVERKKPGLKKARKSPQWAKR
jgi:small subunit ribosomal protein S9